MAKILTLKGVAAARAVKTRREIPDAMLPGLHLIVQPSGAKSWALRYRVGGRSRKYTIGSEKLIDLPTAREKARKAHEAIAAGGDPALLARRNREVASVDESFETIAKRFVERHARIHNRSWKDIERILRVDVLPRWGHRPIASISRHDVVALLDRVVDRGAPVMANRVLGVIRRLFNWCVERGTLETSPCDRVKAPAPETTRDRVHDDRELALIWRAAGTIPYPIGPYIKTLILSGQRRDEVASLTWGEIDLALGLWVLPAARAKNGVQHTIPLSAPVRQILAGLPRFEGCDFAFTSYGRAPISGFSAAKNTIDAAVTQLNGGVPLAHWTFHDFRRDAASGMARSGTPLEVIEKCLNHVSGSFAGITSVYQRYTYRDEMAEALARWARHVTELAP